MIISFYYFLAVFVLVCMMESKREMMPHSACMMERERDEGRGVGSDILLCSTSSCLDY